MAPDADERAASFGLLPELVRESERVMDAQVRAAEELDDKTEHLLRLGVAALAGGITIGTLAVQRAEALVEPAVAGLGLGGVANLLAIALLLQSYNVRFRRSPSVSVGPDPRWLASRPSAEAWTFELHAHHLLASYGDYYRANLETISRCARLRVLGLHALLLSVIAYASVFVLIAGAPIWG